MNLEQLLNDTTPPMSLKFFPAPDKPTLSTTTQKDLNDKYFGPEGVFEQYLRERANTFWFKDFISQTIALFLGCIGYKTDAQKRKEYLDTLKDSFNKWQEDLDGLTENFLDSIKKGQQLFQPRARQGLAGHDKSLHAKLASLENEVNQLQALNHQTNTATV